MRNVAARKCPPGTRAKQRRGAAVRAFRARAAWRRDRRPKRPAPAPRRSRSERPRAVRGEGKGLA